MSSGLPALRSSRRRRGEALAEGVVRPVVLVLAGQVADAAVVEPGRGGQAEQVDEGAAVGGPGVGGGGGAGDREEDEEAWHGGPSGVGWRDSSSVTCRRGRVKGRASVPLFDWASLAGPPSLSSRAVLPARKERTCLCPSPPAAFASRCWRTGSRSARRGARPDVRGRRDGAAPAITGRLGVTGIFPQSDGTLVTVGPSVGDDPTFATGNVVVSRYDAAGKLDSAPSPMTLAIPNQAGTITGVTMDAAGRFIVAGDANDGGASSSPASAPPDDSTPRSGYTGWRRHPSPSSAKARTRPPCSPPRPSASSPTAKCWWPATART